MFSYINFETALSYSLRDGFLSKMDQFLYKIELDFFLLFLTESKQPTDTIKVSLVLLYSLIEGIRNNYVWRLQDLESALIFGGILHPLGITGRMFTLLIGILLIESFVLQLILWFSPISLRKLGFNMNQKQEARFNRESNVIFKITYYPFTSFVRFFDILAVSCGIYYVYYFSFSLQSFCLSLCGVIIQKINNEFCADVYMFYCLLFLYIKKLSYSIASLLVHEQKTISVQIKQFIQVCHQSRLFNQLSMKISSTCFIFGVVINTALYLCVHSLTKSVDELPLFVVVFATFQMIAIFVGRLIYFFGATTPLRQSSIMRNRIYQVIFHKNLSWKDKMTLLNILKNLGNIRTKIALTTIDGRLLETKLLGHHVFYSARVLALFTKLIKA